MPPAASPRVCACRLSCPALRVLERVPGVPIPVPLDPGLRRTPRRREHRDDWSRVVPHPVAGVCVQRPDDVADLGQPEPVPERFGRTTWTTSECFLAFSSYVDLPDSYYPARAVRLSRDR